MAHPIHVNAETVGVVAFQMPIDKINSLMSSGLGLGETGELALIGEDRMMRNDTPLTADKNDILATELSGPVIDKAFAEGSAFGMSTYFGDELMDVEAEKFTYQGKNFAIVAMQPYAEAVTPLTDMRNRMVLAGLALLAIAAALGFFAARSVTKPINMVVSAMNRLADGDTRVETDGSERGDEIGDMFKAVAIFKENAIQRRHLEDQARNERDRERQRQAFLEGVITDFKSIMTDRLATVSDQMERMRGQLQRWKTLQPMPSLNPIRQATPPSALLKTSPPLPPQQKK